jgi:hypothetical protein
VGGGVFWEGRMSVIYQKSRKQTPRERTFLEIIQWLNDNKQGATNLFDCGVLGFALVYWSKYGWEVRWYEAQKWPASCGKGLT